MRCGALVRNKNIIPFCVRGEHGQVKRFSHKNIVCNKIEQTFAVVVDNLLEPPPLEWDKVALESDELLCELLVLLVRLGGILDVKDRDLRRSFDMLSFAFGFVVP